MTQQVPDKLRRGDACFDVVFVRGQGQFYPAHHGLKRAGLRGFLCTYAIEEDRLRLAELQIMLRRKPDEPWPPRVFGALPVQMTSDYRNEHRTMHAIYRPIDAWIALTGVFMLRSSGGLLEFRFEEGRFTSSAEVPDPFDTIAYNSPPRRVPPPPPPVKQSSVEDDLAALKAKAADAAALSDAEEAQLDALRAELRAKK